ncbi:(2Fe-2S)-binding protein [Paenibacillus lentus]|uniref:(2Fe-2S)-binding protein n=2 Tax=Paenibacillus lentus TaxID=1338368 RepID=A0A3Q8SEJ2_9BACL|nr:(2Fe-2S)-binding protein [Paenibacillus lentus]
MDRLAIDYQFLEQQCHVIGDCREQAIYTIAGLDFLDRQRAERFLTLYQAEIKGLDIQVAATYFAASWRVLCTALQYMVSLTSSRLNFNLENLTLQIVPVRQFPTIFFVLHSSSELTWPEGEASEWREAQLGSFYKETLRPVMETAAQVSGLPVTQLWGQLPLGVTYYLRQLANQLETEEQRNQLRTNYEYLRTISPDWFGIRRNPFVLKEILVDNPYSPGEKMPLKPTCCLAYRTDTGLGYCYSCPKLTKKQREQKRAELMQQQMESSSK